MNDEKIVVGLKCKVHHMVVKPILLYGPECWPVKKTRVQRMKVAKMRMIRWMCGHTRLNRIRNEMTRDEVGVASIEDNIRTTRLRWFGYINRRSVDALVRRSEAINFPEYRSGGGWPKQSCDEVIKHD